jgi:hypothetical protein
MVRNDLSGMSEDRYVQQAAKRRVSTEDQALHAPLVSERPKLHSDRQPQTPAAADASPDGSQTRVAPIEIFLAAAFTLSPPHQPFSSGHKVAFPATPFPPPASTGVEEDRRYRTCIGKDARQSHPAA